MELQGLRIPVATFPALHVLSMGLLCFSMESVQITSRTTGEVDLLGLITGLWQSDCDVVSCHLFRIPIKLRVVYVSESEARAAVPGLPPLDDSDDSWERVSVYDVSPVAPASSIVPGVWYVFCFQHFAAGPSMIPFFYLGRRALVWLVRHWGSCF